MSWGAASDNVGVTGYSYRLNGGSWISIGNVLSVNLSGLAGGIASYTFDVRAQDAAGNPGPAATLVFQALYQLSDPSGIALTSLYTTLLFCTPFNQCSFTVTQAYGSLARVRLANKPNGTTVYTDSQLNAGYSDSGTPITYASYAIYGH